MCLHCNIDWPTKVMGNNEQGNAEMFKPKKACTNVSYGVDMVPLSSVSKQYVH